MMEIVNPARPQRFLFAPERREVGRGIIFGAVSAALIGAFAGVLLAAGLGLLGMLSPSAGSGGLHDTAALCAIAAVAGTYLGFQIGICTTFVQFILVAVWIPPGNWELARREHRRGMLYGALLGAALCPPLTLWGQIDALTAEYSQPALNSFRENYFGWCFILPPLGLIAGGCIAMLVAVARIRAGKEYRTPFPLPFPFHKVVN